jgi:peroxiredoxin
MRKFALSLAVLALAAAPALAGKYNTKVSVGDKAPSFSGVAATTPKGEEVSVSLPDLKEDVVILVFQANHCPMVVAYEDRVNDLAAAYPGKNVKLVSIAVSGQSTRKQDDLSAIKAKVAEKDSKINFTYGFDDTQAIGRAYGVTTTPQFFVLDKARNIRYTGALDDNAKESAVKVNYVKAAVDSLLAGKDVEVTETKARGCGVQYDK